MKRQFLSWLDRWVERHDNIRPIGGVGTSCGWGWPATGGVSRSWMAPWSTGRSGRRVALRQPARRLARSKQRRLPVSTRALPSAPGAQSSISNVPSTARSTPFVARACYGVVRRWFWRPGSSTARFRHSVGGGWGHGSEFF